MTAKSRTFVYDYDAPVDAVWAAMADTARYNEAAGLPRHDIDEEILGNNAIRFRASARMGPFTLEWEDLHCNWVRDHWFRHERRFSKGPLATLIAELRLEAQDDDRCRGHYRVEASPSGFLGSVILGTGFFPGTKKMFERLSVSAVRWARGEQELAFPTDPPALAETVRNRIDTAVRVLERSPHHHGLARRLARFIAEAPETEIQRIRPLALAKIWHTKPKNTIELCLEATRAGLLELHWDILCPRCRVAKATANTLDALPDGAHCGTCNIDYGREFARNVELSFRPTPGIREVVMGEFCLLGPMSTPHILAHVTVPAGEERQIEWAPPPGPYRLRTLEAGPSLDLDHEEGEFPDVVVTGDAVLVEKAAGPTGFRLVNHCPWPRTILVEDRTWSADALTADRVTALQAFRDLFSAEVLRPGDEVGISRITLLFSDLVGSTALYERIGDAGAYHLVREHFAFMQRIVRELDGTVVKTIGDAVMAAFYEPANAVRAGIAMQERLRSEEARNAPRIKLGIHVGPCIAVTLNDRLDYFGTTVNMAARLQALSAGDDMILSHDLTQEPAVAELITEYPARSENAELKGFDEPVPFTRLRFDGVPTPESHERRHERFG